MYAIGTFEQSVSCAFWVTQYSIPVFAGFVKLFRFNDVSELVLLPDSPNWSKICCSGISQCFTAFRVTGGYPDVQILELVIVWRLIRNLGQIGN